MRVAVCYFFFFQAEDGIRDLVRSRGLGDVYKRQADFSPLEDPLFVGHRFSDEWVGQSRVRWTAVRNLSLIHI